MKDVFIPKNYGGPIQYLGNRYMTLPDLSGHMKVDTNWLSDLFSIFVQNRKGRKFKRCFEPFAGSASWSLAAMEINFAEEYIINDSDEVLINCHRLIKQEPNRIKNTYTSLLEEYNRTTSKKEYFLKTINAYNEMENDRKPLILPFIINHSWGGIIFHDDKGNIVYYEENFDGKTAPRYLEKANLNPTSFLYEVDRVSQLLNKNKVIFKSGDFLNSLVDVQAGDCVVLNPPYPENIRKSSMGMYLELYSPVQLHTNLMNIMHEMDANDIQYCMTYGLYNPTMKQFVIRNEFDQLKHFLRILGYENCAFGTALDQMYFSANLSIPEEMSSRIIAASDVLKDKDFSPEEALKVFNEISTSRVTVCGAIELKQNSELY